MAGIGADDRLIDTAIRVSLTLGVDGHRADLTLVKTALVFAALDGHEEVKGEHVLKAAGLALPHRLRRRPFEESRADLGVIKTLIGECYGSP